MTISGTALNFCSEPVDLFCPVCGEQIFSHGIQKKICCHVVFTADSAANNWTWHQQQYAQRFYIEVETKYSTACKNGFYGDLETYSATLRPDTAATLAAKAITQKSAFMVSISTADIGCGGMHNGTIYAIFDYLPAAAKLIQPTTLKDATRGGNIP